MNKFKTLSIVFLMLLFGASCTEQIADNLKNTDQSATASTSEKAIGKKMKLIHTMDENLSYYMHSVKGRSYPCELEATGQNFSSATYEKSDSKDVADCILEVEELDLFFEGVKFELEVDDYLCEYINYKPFKFYQYPVGKTTQKQYKVQCDSSCSAAQDGAGQNFCNQIEGTYLTYEGEPALPAEAEISGSLNEFTNKTEASCKFDYTDNLVPGPNCDPGSITTYTYNVFPDYNYECIGDGPGVSSRTSTTCEVVGVWTAGVCTGGAGGETDSATCTGAGGAWTAAFCDQAGRADETSCVASGSWEPVAYCDTTSVAGSGSYDNNIVIDTEPAVIEDCGGTAYNCLAGPALEHLSKPEYSGVIYENRDLSSFTKEWEIASSLSKGRYTNRYIANYSRICSNNQTKSSYYDNVLTSATGLVGSEIETRTPSPKDPYDATDVTQLYQKESVDYNNDGNDDYIVYADHPFLGVTELNTRARSTVIPYYAFNCLDKARDVKAQIRLYIREWDRMFDKDEAKMEYVSDVDDPSSSTRLIDNDGYYDDDQAWNNYKDWDDFLDGKFTNDACDGLVNETNPGQCYKDLAAGDTQATCTVAGEVWVDQNSKCYVYNAGSNQSGKKACEDEASDQKWIWGLTNSSFTKNFPYDSL